MFQNLDSYLDQARRYLWIVIEIAFLIVLASLLLHLALGQYSGGFIKDVYDNLVALGRDVPAATLLGVGALFLLVWYIQQRARQ
jgi:hypothetical protein